MAVTARTLACVAACALAALGVAVPANAGDGDDALQKMQTAVRSAGSFTARFEPTIPMSWVVVQPDRIRRAMPSRDGDSMEDDKATYLPTACWFPTVAKMYVTTSYEHWNDPANVIEPPPGVRP